MEKARENAQGAFALLSRSWPRAHTVAQQDVIPQTWSGEVSPPVSGSQKSKPACRSNPQLHPVAGPGLRFGEALGRILEVPGQKPVLISQSHPPLLEPGPALTAQAQAGQSPVDGLQKGLRTAAPVQKGRGQIFRGNVALIQKPGRSGAQQLTGFLCLPIPAGFPPGTAPADGVSGLII